ncbi:MAG: TetR/AcrR family transcriptional regulator [Lachnospiraceae bacterium]|nr:TetR/AcrR family transcriptional regulator [Lachnospiraceae bacterium]
MKKGERRKLELLKIAYRLFISKGYENTSVDEIIEEAGIAKGTYYYYFESKEQMLEDVIEMMIDTEVETARLVLGAPIPVEQKIVGIISSIRPTQEESPIEGLLMKPENALMHKKTKQKIIEKLVPLLTEVVEEGISRGVFDCENIPERVRFLLILSSETFDESLFGENDITVFIDMMEKLLGAKAGTMGFVRMLIASENNDEKEK